MAGVVHQDRRLELQSGLARHVCLHVVMLICCCLFEIYYSNTHQDLDVLELFSGVGSIWLAATEAGNMHMLLQQSVVFLIASVPLMKFLTPGLTARARTSF